MFPRVFTPQTFALADVGGALFLNRYFPVISINVVKRKFLFASRTNVSMNSIMPNARNEQCIQQHESEKLFAIKSRRIEIFCFRFSELNLCFHALLCWCFNWFSFQRSEMQFIMNEKDSKISAFLMKPLWVLCCDFWWKLSTALLVLFFLSSLDTEMSAKRHLLQVHFENFLFKVHSKVGDRHEGHDLLELFVMKIYDSRVSSSYPVRYSPTHNTRRMITETNSMIVWAQKMGRKSTITPWIFSFSLGDIVSLALQSRKSHWSRNRTERKMSLFGFIEENRNSVGDNFVTPQRSRKKG